MELGATFDDRKREKKKDRERQQPERERHGDGGGPGNDPQRIEAGEHEAIHDGDALESEAVGGGQNNVGREAGNEGGARRCGKNESGDEAQRGEDRPSAHRHGPGGEGALTFARMEAVAL